jgi:hypothetical protein
LIAWEIANFNSPASTRYYEREDPRNETLQDIYRRQDVQIENGAIRAKSIGPALLIFPNPENPELEQNLLGHMNAIAAAVGGLSAPKVSDMGAQSFAEEYRELSNNCNVCSDSSSPAYDVGSVNIMTIISIYLTR